MREIGRGGMGAVWLGRDERLGRDVALKRIGVLPGLGRTDVARAEREAHLAARLHHPHVVAVFDVVADDESDARWLVMEYVDGTDLARVVRERGALTPETVTPVLRQVTDALLAAHSAGIVHRDVKPSNVLIDRDGRARLTDFGIARLHTDPALTQTGMVTGSPTYLAPEIASGARGDEASDVWSLGATAFHLLTGRPPYETGDALTTLYQVVNSDPPRADVGALTPLLQGALVKEPSQRWTMTEVGDFLRDGSLPAGWTPPVDTVETATVLPPVAAPVAAVGTATARRRRHPVLVGVAVALLLAVTVGGFVLGRELNTSSSGGPSSVSPTPTPAPSPSPSDGPTEAGMVGFIEDYVAAVARDPAESWRMLTPKFQYESGGFTAYEAFWAPATSGRVLDISADPETLVVSYQVAFEGKDNGPGPTVLQLRYDDGRYRIDGEMSEGFTPAG